MKKISAVFLFLMLFQLISWALVCAEDLPDFSSVRNPFAKPEFLIPEIKKTSVEPPPRSMDNVIKPTPVVTPIEPLIKQIDVSRAAVNNSPGIPVNLNLKGVLWGGNKPLVILNDVVVGVGERVGKILVKKIYKDGVDVVINGDEKHVQMDK